MKKVIVIVGQTATGKSALAVKLAKKHNGEIISADSRQVYKGLDIGTGKITPKEMQGVPHHLLDVANPKRKFTVAQYQKLATRAMSDIISRGKTPIIVGGTGFYVDAITKGTVFPEVPPNLKLRKKYTLLDGRQLLHILKKLDPTRAKTIDPHNKVRLIRAIEIAQALGKVPSPTAVKPLYEFIKIGLTLNKNQLKAKIKNRLGKRIRIGMVNEARKLQKQGLSRKRMLELGLEYRYLALFLDGKIDKGEMLSKLNSEIYKYAKRQMTWFKKDREINWFSPTTYSQISALVKKQISSN